MKPSAISTRHRVTAGFVAGLIGGAVFSLLVNPSPLGIVTHLVVSAGLGLIFGLIVGPKIRTAGAGLVWGEAYGLLWWLVGSLTLVPLLSGQDLSWSIRGIQQTFPHLLGQVVGYGMVLGLSFYLLLHLLARMLTGTEPEAEQARPGVPRGQEIVPPPVQAIITGGLGGTLGSWVFARGIERAEFFPLVASLMGSNSMMVGQTLHYTIGTFMGISFGLLFFRDIQGAGSGLVWGMNYGLTWWIIGPLTLLPGLPGFGGQPDWSLAAAQSVFAALVAHMLYGALVGLFYALANKLWHVLFVDSDPLNRTAEGPGTRGVRSLLMGQAGGVVGGLLFTIIMLGTGALPVVASLIGARSLFVGFIVHLIISIIVGSSYGLLFRQEVDSYGSGLAWGLVYGLLWWLLGQLTLFPIILRQPVDWSLATVVAFYPALIGHLLYGAGLGLFFHYLAQRFDAPLGDRPPHVPSTRPTTGSPAPALWTTTLVLGTLLPLLVSMAG